MISNMVLSFKRTDGLTLCKKESCISLLLTPSLQYNNHKFLNTIWMIRFSITNYTLFSEQNHFVSFFVCVCPYMGWAIQINNVSRNRSADPFHREISLNHLCQYRDSICFKNNIPKRLKFKRNQKN